MLKFKTNLLVGMLLSFNVLANSVNNDTIVYDKNISDLLYAVSDCTEQLKQVLSYSDGIKEVALESRTSPHGDPAYQVYSISTFRGDFFGPLLSIHRQFTPSTSSDASDKGKWTTECLIAY